jgi:hypothetical protein
MYFLSSRRPASLRFLSPHWCWRISVQRLLLLGHGSTPLVEWLESAERTDPFVELYLSLSVQFIIGHFCSLRRPEIWPLLAEVDLHIFCLLAALQSVSYNLKLNLTDRWLNPAGMTGIVTRLGDPGTNPCDVNEAPDFFGFTIYNYIELYLNYTTVCLESLYIKFPWRQFGVMETGGYSWHSIGPGLIWLT